ncbi:MAG: KUP/HAK/KT family potassium transporter [Oligoflexales bacterium]|nr:KUP/HAK/KT family potassium transporter [Oligoflexales bacterium]
MKNPHNVTGLHKVISALGLVFGDIGTSPIYTMTVIFLILKPTETNVLGVVSLIIWTLLTVVTVGYVILAMNLNMKGEGGTIVLKEIALKYLNKGRRYGLVMFLTYLGVSLLIGDGVITPAISILSAVEGLTIIDVFAEVSNNTLIFIACVITVALFAFQKKGTQKISNLFGPIMAIWFLALAISGISSIWKYPAILKAFNPMYGIRFIFHEGFSGFFILSEVILCATGGEALYADMGHLGKAPISRAWYISVNALFLNYLGQGAYIYLNPDTKNILYEMVADHAPLLYVPFLVLSIIATVIASQAMISGMFSIVYQGIMTRMMPLLKIDYTSTELKSQIYIGSVNWLLMVCVLWVIMIFGASDALANAYGIAVTGTMTITGILMVAIFIYQKLWWKLLMAIIITFIDLCFLFAVTSKIQTGGYWSLIIASVPFFLILIYVGGQKRLAKKLKLVPLADFLQQYHETLRSSGCIKGTALYFLRELRLIPPYIVNNILEHSILYEDNILTIINTTNEPFEVTFELSENIANGLRVLTINRGYKEVVDVTKILKELEIESKVIFYGIEEIVTEKLRYSIFAVIKRNTPSFVKFYRLPFKQLHGVITRVEI